MFFGGGPEWDHYNSFLIENFLSFNPGEVLQENAFALSLSSGGNGNDCDQNEQQKMFHSVLRFLTVRTNWRSKTRCFRPAAGWFAYLSRVKYDHFFLRVGSYKYEYDLFEHFVSLLPQRYGPLKELITRNAQTSGAL